LERTIIKNEKVFQKTMIPEDGEGARKRGGGKLSRKEFGGKTRGPAKKCSTWGDLLESGKKKRISRKKSEQKKLRNGGGAKKAKLGKNV